MGTTVLEGLVVTDLDVLNNLLQVRCVEDEPEVSNGTAHFNLNF